LVLSVEEQVATIELCPSKIVVPLQSFLFDTVIIFKQEDDITTWGMYDSREIVTRMKLEIDIFMAALLYVR